MDDGKRGSRFLCTSSHTHNLKVNSSKDERSGS